MKENKKAGLFLSDLFNDERVSAGQLKKSRNNAQNERIRKRSFFFKRLCEGIKCIKYKPWKAVPTFLLWAVAVFQTPSAAIWVSGQLLGLPFAMEVLQSVEHYINTQIEEVNIEIIGKVQNMFIGIGMIIALLLLLAILVALGKAKNARRIDPVVWDSFGLEMGLRRWYARPYLISNRPAWHYDKDITNKYVSDYEFWSYWIPLSEWQEKDFLDSLCDKMGLDVKSADVRRGGKNGLNTHTVIIRALPLEKVINNTPTSDPLFRNGA